MAKLLQELAQLGAELVIAVGDRDHPVDGEPKFLLVRGQRAQVFLVHPLPPVRGIRRGEQLEGDQVAPIGKPEREVRADGAVRQPAQAARRKP